MKPALLALLLFGLTVDASAQTEQQWRARAVERYPELGVQGSPLNKQFIAEYNQRRKSSPAFFTDPRWPLTLADELATPPPSPEPAKEPANPPTNWISDQFHRMPPNWRLPVGVGAGLIGVLFLGFCVEGLKRRLHWRRIRLDHDAYLDLVRRSRAVPTVETTLMLKQHEEAYYSAPSSLYETRAVRNYRSAFAGFRVAKGLYIGGSQGRSVSSQEWSKIAAGVLTITNKRIIFSGDGSDRTVAIPKVISVEPMRDSVEISVEGRQKSMVFAAANPLILASIIRISCDIQLQISQGK